MAGILTVDDFRKRVENHEKRLAISRSGGWFRGHSCGNWYLLPGILRRTNGLQHERNLYASFQTQSGNTSRQYPDSWEMLAVMQHYGMPTRLLDWTEDLNAALFFAVQGKLDQPCLWIMNPYRLNLKATGRNLIYDSADKLGIDYFQTVCVEKNWPYEFPVALAPPWTNDRVKAQRGYFTFHGKNSGPLELVVPECVKRAPIPPELVKDLRHDLRRAGTDAYKLFPDLEGLSRKLKDEYKFP